jgi:hypothetical protein
MSLTKVSYSMIKGAPFNVLDYASLATTVTAKDPSDPVSHLFSSFLSWKLPIQRALDDCYDAGGGTVVLPKNTVPYYIDDTIIVYDNTTFVCEDWIILADYTTTGGSFGANGSNIVVQNLMLDNSDIYAGGSGQNGIGAGAGLSGVGKNIKFFGGIVKNCHQGVGGPADGGKGIQIEPGDGEDIVVDGMTFSNCFMAMSTIRDFATVDPYYGIVYSNITADNCGILFFVRQSNGAQSQTGLQHSVQLNNFYAVNCGTYEGVLQFSRASNVMVSNGIVVVDPAVSATSLVRGNHANCTFTNISWYGDTASCVNLDPSTYAIDDSQPNENNRYDINVWGQVDFFANATVTTSNPTLNGCSGNVTFRLAPATAFFGYELRNGTSLFNISCNTGPFGASKFVLANTNLNYNTSALPYTFAGFADGYNVSGTQNISFNGFKTIAAASVGNDTLFLDTATGKLSYKNSAGVVNALY